MNRRDVLKSIPALALASSPALAMRFHGGNGTSAFNNGRTQWQSTVPGSSGDFPFINLLNCTGNNWVGTGTDNSGAVIDPSWLDANGYPIASLLARDTFGVLMNMSLPPSTSRISNVSSPMVLTWVGNAVVRIGNAPVTTVSGSTTAVLNGYGFSDGLYHGRYVWYPTSYLTDSFHLNQYPFQLNIQSIDISSSVNNLQLYFSADETALLSGQLFGIKYKQVIQAANPGILRFMDWLFTNGSNTTTWGTRKSSNVPVLISDEYRASLYVGDIMTNSGNNYSLTTGSFTLADKLTMHIHFNVNGTVSVNSQGFSFGPSPQTLTASITSPGPSLLLGWTAHGLSNGQPMGAIFQGNAFAGMQSGVNYFVVNATTNTFQLALTVGGSPIAPAVIAGGSIALMSMATLTLNGSAAIPIRDNGGSPLLAAVCGFNGSAKIYGTVVYDAVLNCWLMSGGTNNTSAGLQNVIPPEICFRLCKEIGAHPHFSIPYLALDKMTDYVPSLAAYLKANGPSWMIPRFEAGNEIWNNLTPITNYANSKAWAYWQADNNDWSGMITSTMGQAVAAVYGHGNLGTTYEVMIGVQTDGMNYPLSNPFPGLDSRMTSAQYVASGPAQAGFTQSAASGWASAVLPSTYISPGMRGLPSEWQNAFDYFVTSIANPTQQAADLNAFVDTLTGASGTAVFTNGLADVTWTGNPLLATQTIIFGAPVPPNVVAGKTYAVLSRTTNTFQFSTSIGGSVVTPNGNATGTVAVSAAFNINYETARWHGSKDWASRFSVNKMFAYEGGYSPDLMPSFYDLLSPLASGMQSSAQTPVPTKAAQCVITVADGTTADRGIGSITTAANPCAIGMLVYLSGVSGMTQLNCNNSANTSFPTFSSTVPDVTWTGHGAHPNQVVVFSENFAGALPTNIIAGTRYFVISTNLTTNTFQFSATRGGSAIQPNATTTGGVLAYSAFVVTGVSGNSTTIDVDSTGFTTATSGPIVNYPNSLNLINNFRTATLLFATDMQAQMTASFNAFVAQGGAFPSQYEVSGTQAIWPPVQPDIYGTQGGEFAAIVAFNH